MVNIPFNVDDTRVAERLQRIEAAFRRLAGVGESSSKAAANALKDGVAIGERYESVLKKIIADEERFGAVTRQVAIDLLEENKILKDRAAIAKELAASERQYESIRAASFNAATRRQNDFVRQQERAQRNAQSEARQAALESNQTVYAASRSFGLFTPLNASSGGVAAAAAAGYALKQVAETIKDVTVRFAEFGREQTNLSIRTGLSIQSVQLYSRVAEAAGVNVQGLVAGVRNLARGLSESSDEGKRMKAVLFELGLDKKVAALPPDALIPLIFAKTQQTKNPFDRERQLQTLLGKGVSEQFPAIQRFDELSAKLINAGVLLPDAEIKKAEKFRTDLAILEAQFDSLKLKVGSGIVGTINFLLNGKPLDQAAVDATIGYLLAATGPLAGIGPIGGIGLVSSGRDLINRFKNRNVPKDSLSFLTPTIETKNREPEPDELQRQADIDKIDAIIGGSEAGGDSAKERGLNKRIAELRTELTGARNKVDVPGVERITFQIDSLKREVEYLKEIEQIKKRTFDLDEQANLKKFGQLGAIEARRVNALREIDVQIKKSERFGLTGEVSELEAEKAKQDHSFGVELGLEARKIADQQRKALNKIDAETEIHSIARESDKSFRLAQLKAGPEGLTAQDVDKNTQDRIDAARQEAKIREDVARSETYSEDKIQDANKRVLALKEEQAQLARKIADIEQDAALQKAEIEKKATQRKEAADREIENLRTNASRDVIIRQFNRQGRLSDLSFGPDREGEAAVDSYRRRIALSRELYNEEFKRALVEKDANKQRVDFEKAEDALFKTKADARIELELKIEEIKKRARDDDRRVAGQIFDALIKGPAALQDELKKLALGSLRTIFQNVGSGVISRVGDQIHGAIPGQVDQKGELTPLGKVLKGTIFGVDQSKIAQDQLNKITQDNTVKTADNTAALQALTESLKAGLKATGINSDGTITGSTSAITEAATSAATDALSGVVAGGAGGLGGEDGETPTFSTTVTAKAKNSLLGDVFSGLASVLPRKDKDGNITGGLFSGIYGGNQSVGQRVGNIAGSVGATIAGVQGIASGISQGGARGILGAAGSALALAGSLPTPAAPFLQAGALALGLVKSLFGDRRQERDKEITRELQDIKYTAPNPVTLSVDSSGRSVDTDFRGRLRVLNSSPQYQFYNQITGFDPLHSSELVSSTQRRIVNGASTPSVTVIAPVSVSTMDAKSFLDHSSHIADALHKSIDESHPIRNVIINKLVRPK